MDEATAKALLALNRDFYRSFAQAFSASRSVGDPALSCILPHIPRAATVLDVGCGSGRLAMLLDRERPESRYVGLDVAPELISIAREELSRLERITGELFIADISQPGWSDVIRGRRFDCIMALAVLHHIPGPARRARVLREMAGVVGSSGRVALSTWQFLDSPRLRRKVVPWDEAGMCGDQVDPGDFLLDWRRGGRGLRYCHLVDEDEVQLLAAEAGLRVTHTFRAGGREGNLSLFSILAPKSGAAAAGE